MRSHLAPFPPAYRLDIELKEPNYVLTDWSNVILERMDHFKRRAR